MLRQTRTRIVFLAVAMAFTFVTGAFAEDYSFQVTNNTDQAIKKILVSEDGEKYGFFDIGAGIKAGATVELVWAQSTDDESCEQYFKAVFADGSESEATKFDFCEAEVALEFD